jgi:hypothetical protein
MFLFMFFLDFGGESMISVVTGKPLAADKSSFRI